MPYMPTWNALRWLNEFHPYMGELTSMRAMYLGIVEVEGPLVTSDGVNGDVERFNPTGECVEAAVGLLEGAYADNK